MPTNTASPSRIATPWGRTTLVEQVGLSQIAGDKRFRSLVELLETEKGEYLIRIAYSTDGVVRRGPVTLRSKDIEKLRTALAKAPALSAVLGLGADA
jgi:hypothetical protein